MEVCLRSKSRGSVLNILCQLSDLLSSFTDDVGDYQNPAISIESQLTGFKVCLMAVSRVPPLMAIISGAPSGS